MTEVKKVRRRRFSYGGVTRCGCGDGVAVKEVPIYRYICIKFVGKFEDVVIW